MNNTTDDSDTIKIGMEIGAITLGEFLADPQNGRKISAQQRARALEGEIYVSQALRRYE